jgi:dTDP-4-amino-4,6-dideoxygalactose transaminase
MTPFRVPYVDFSTEYRNLRSEILEAVDGVFAGGRYVLGGSVSEFEERFAELIGVKHAISVANGTDALFLALYALGIGEGDEVITAPNSFVASTAVITQVGATPVFADVSPDRNIDPISIEKAVTDRTRAILPVHLGGKCADMTAIIEIAQRHELFVIEDAAQSVASTHAGRTAGAFGDVGCFSLHPLKNLNAMGDGGVMTTSDDELAGRLRLLRNHGIVDRDRVTEWGFNSRLDEVQAAIVNVKMLNLSKVIERRRAIADTYRSGIGELIECPVETPGDFHTYHTFTIQVDDRDGLQASLRETGIDSKVHYPVPIHLLEAARELGYKKGDLPVVERQADRILSIPVHQHLRDEQVALVINAVKSHY